jgi:sugar phosphate isomerase/epimerase
MASSRSTVSTRKESPTVTVAGNAEPAIREGHVTKADLVLCSGTLNPNVGFRERVEAAAAAGFDGLSLWVSDYRSGRAGGLSDADMRTMLDDNGIAIAELDLAWWWLPGSPETAPEIMKAAFAYDEADVFAIADAVGVRSLNAADVFGGEWEVEDAAKSFAALCDRAAEHGLLVHIESLPWSTIPDLATAWQIVDLADRPNGGVLIDAWHWARGTNDLALLRSLPGDKVLAIQLDDGPAQPEADLITATMHERLLPGEGEFDLAGLVDALRATGTRAPWGVEVFSDELHALPARDAATRAAAATRKVLA